MACKLHRAGFKIEIGFNLSNWSGKKYAPRLELVALSKRYAQVCANDAISLRVAAGEIHALVGENGAGKSTLLSMIYGLTQADEGAILWEGREREILGPQDARKLGIGIVMQHFSLFPELDVLDNLYLHASVVESVSRQSLALRAKEKMTQLGLNLSLTACVSELALGQRQQIEILRCLLQPDLKLLILDEPTAVLTVDEADQLLTLLERLSLEGCSIVYVSHKLHEVCRIASQATVLRRGKVVGHCSPVEVGEAHLASLMVGGDIESASRERHTQALREEGLALNALTTPYGGAQGAPLKAVDVLFPSGAVSGVAGVSGSGQNALVDAISGELMGADGQLSYQGRALGSLTLAQRYLLGISVIAAERKERCVEPSMTLLENYYAKYRLKHPATVIPWGELKARVSALIDQFDIACAGPEARAGSLSGGNLQKFILARELSLQPQVLICHQPTWGVDIRSAAFIWQQLRQVADDGAVVVVLSEDLDELLAQTDAIAVLHDGQLSPLIARVTLSRQQLGEWMSGLAFGNGGQRVAVGE